MQLRSVPLPLMLVVLGANLGTALHAQNANSISDQEACQRMKTLLPLAQTIDDGHHLFFAQITGSRLNPAGFALSLKKRSDLTIAYSDLKDVVYNVVVGWSGGQIYFGKGNDEVAERFFKALSHLAAAAHAGQTPDCTIDPKAELDIFIRKAAAWRALTTKPVLSDEVTKKRLLAEDAIQERDLGAAVDDYKAGVDIDSTWAQGWYNAALICAELKNYSDAAFYMKHYLILQPDAPDAAAAKEKVLLWEAKAEAAGSK
jgi:hypothetical protein